MDVVFLDANVLFSAAWRADAGLGRLWRLTGAQLITSVYAVEEARRNLEEPDQVRRLEDLLPRMRIVPEVEDRSVVGATDLPDKDRPIPCRRLPPARRIS